MKFAIYSRKSKFTGKGESIENQIEMCKNYINNNYSNDENIEIDVYEDEGISGKTLNRPQFQKLMKALKNREYQYLVVYRLDRVSRNVGDFSHLIDELNALNVSFVSIKEQFDTTSPMGRAMMNIASVFAQLERETIAERIRDNAYMLAKTGRWLGGVTALGFTSQKLSGKDEENKTRTEYKLSVIDEEMIIVKLIFDKYLEKQSLSSVETYLMNNAIKTRKGSYFTKRSIRKILENPVYCTADDESYKYFDELGCQVCCDEEQLNNGNGFIGYRKTATKNDIQKENDYQDWIIAVGKHNGIINSSDWLKVQSILLRNKPQGEQRRVQSTYSLLSGILICGDCGSFMRPKAVGKHRFREDCQFDYICELKERSRRNKCDICNINGTELDNKVCEELFKYDIPESKVSTQLDKIKKNIKDYKGYQFEINFYERKIKEVEDNISSIILSCVKNATDESINYMNGEISKQDKLIKQYTAEKEKLISEYNFNKKATKELKQSLTLFDELKEKFYKLSVVQKRDIIRTIIDKVIYNRNGSVDIFLRGNL